MPDYYIQYHNADEQNSYPTPNINFDLKVDELELDDSALYGEWIFTRKKLVEKAVGQNCFLIVGKTEKVKKYYLWAFFKIEEYKKENDEYTVLGTGHDLKKPILLNQLEGFDDLKKFCGNFGIGFQNITNHSFCDTLASYTKVLFPSVKLYQEAIEKLTVGQKNTLQTLYYFPNSSATAKELAKALDYESYHAANRQIGQIGKVISQHTGIIPPNYNGNNGGKQPAYFLMIGEYFKDKGWVMWKEMREALESLNLVSNNEDDLIERLTAEMPEEDEKKLFKEGKLSQVFVNKYERDRNARLECINHHGAICKVCDFSFEDKFGDIGKGFIHVHHKIEISTIGEEYSVDPISDLIPVCPNCHAMLHRRIPAYSIDELKMIIK